MIHTLKDLAIFEISVRKTIGLTEWLRTSLLGGAQVVMENV